VIRIFIGYDPREAVAFNVLSHSIHVRSSQPIAITPINLSQLKMKMWRARVNLQSTEFSFSRFLTPYLCIFEGWAIFLDCDMLFLDDISKLWDLRDDKYAVQCVKHNHVPEEKVKFLNQTQTIYEKKNWSSVMLLNCSKCRMLTPEYVNTASGLELHCFRWLSDERQIGDIPHRWNHLVDYDPEKPIDKISNLHFTSGGPYYEEYKNCGYASTWRKERDDMLFANKG
jgi:lipopolysaccharide biosynthesis glycosyltransferase